MKVTIRIDRDVWDQAKHDCITEGKTLGELVTEGLELRREIKQEHRGHGVDKGKR